MSSCCSRKKGVVPTGQSRRRLIAIHEIRIVLTIAEKSHDECRMLLVRSDGNHETISIHNTRAEVSVAHALPHLLRAGQILCQVVLRPRKSTLQGCQICSEGQFRRIACDGYAGDSSSDVTMVKMTV